jgi:hypothetical protein
MVRTTRDHGTQTEPTELLANHQERITERNTALQGESEDILPIYRLHNELLQHIGNLLPLASAAAFSLCSRRLLHTLGSEYLQKCSGEGRGDNKHALLELLSRSLDGYIACHQCLKLHRVNFPLGRRLCTTADVMALVSTIVFPSLSFVHLQMAMKLHRLGQDPSPYLDPLTTGSPKYMQLPGVDARNLTSRLSLAPHVSHKPRIDNDELLFRSQYCLRLPWRSLRDFHSTWITAEHDLGYFNLCSHLSLQDSRLKALFSRLCFHYSGNVAWCEACHVLHECSHCGAEFMACMKDYGRRGVVFVLTRWVNFGAVRSQYDQKWTRHLEWTSNYRIQPARGNAMTRFEKCAQSEFEPVLTENQENVLFCTER